MVYAVYLAAGFGEPSCKGAFPAEKVIHYRAAPVNLVEERDVALPVIEFILCYLRFFLKVRSRTRGNSSDQVLHQGLQRLGALICGLRRRLPYAFYFWLVRVIVQEVGTFAYCE